MSVGLTLSGSTTTSNNKVYNLILKVITSDIDGNNVNTSGFTAYSSAGTAERVYEEATPYDKDDLFNLSFTTAFTVKANSELES